MESTTRRLYFFDNLRAFSILLTVLFHVALGYMTWNLDWCLISNDKSILADLFIFSGDVFIIPTLFFITGYFALLSLQKKRLPIFWKNKLLRIIAPWIFGVLFCSPIIVYSAFFLTRPVAAPPAYLHFWLNDFFGPSYQQEHYWFLGQLTFFFGLLTLAALAFPQKLHKAARPQGPSPLFLLAFLLLTAFSFWAASLIFHGDPWVPALGGIFFLQPLRLGTHIAYFFLGAYAWKNNWFQPGGYRPALLPWCLAALAALVLFLWYRMTFTLAPNPTPLIRAGHALTRTLHALTMVLALLALFQRFSDKISRLWQPLADNSYTVYFIHLLVIIPVGLLLQPLAMPIALRFLLSFAATLLGSILLAKYLIQPVLGHILHTAKNKRT